MLFPDYERQTRRERGRKKDEGREYLFQKPRETTNYESKDSDIVAGEMFYPILVRATHR
jgi:hypothetical protein